MGVPLFHTVFWVQIHDLPTRMHTEVMAKQFNAFIQKFRDYDAKAIAAGLQNFMHVRLVIDVQKPLKRRKKLIFRNDKEFCVSFK